jgi:hypothetical protein
VSDLEAALRQTAEQLHAALAGVSETQATQKPDPNVWSVAECLEHLVLSERGMLHRIQAAPIGDPLPDDTVPDNAARRNRISGLAGRETRLAAPPHVQPAGRFGSFAATLAQWDLARAATIEFAREHAADLAFRTVRHPLFGDLTGGEMMMVIAAHARRHTTQIQEILG